MMGRKCCILLGLLAGLAVSGCRDGDAPVAQPTVSATASASATASPTPSATPVPAGARSISEETDDFLFEYAYPAEVGNIPELATLLDSRLTRLRDELAGQAAEGREAARDNGFPYNKYSIGTEWQRVADLPDYLSLSAEVSSYTGGAHGNFGFDSLVWDKARAIALEPEAFFTSAEALDDALKDALCEDLQVERAKRRGEDAQVGGMFDECVTLADTTILLGSGGGKAFDRIGVQIGPYVAGPWAEGTYEFTFPVTEAVLDAVAEPYKDAFAVR